MTLFLETVHFVCNAIAAFIARLFFRNGGNIGCGQAGRFGALLFSASVLSSACALVAVRQLLPSKLPAKAPDGLSDLDWLALSLFVALPPAAFLGLLCGGYRYQCHIGNPEKMFPQEGGWPGALATLANLFVVVTMAIVILLMSTPLAMLAILPALLVTWVGKHWGLDLYHSGTFAVLQALILSVILVVWMYVSEKRVIPLGFAMYGALTVADAFLEYMVVLWQQQRRLAPASAAPPQFGLSALLAFVLLSGAYASGLIMVLDRNKDCAENRIPDLR